MPSISRSLQLCFRTLHRHTHTHLFLHVPHFAGWERAPLHQAALHGMPAGTGVGEDAFRAPSSHHITPAMLKRLQRRPHLTAAEAHQPLPQPVGPAPAAATAFTSAAVAAVVIAAATSSKQLAGLGRGAQVPAGATSPPQPARVLSRSMRRASPERRPEKDRGRGKRYVSRY